MLTTKEEEYSKLSNNFSNQSSQLACLTSEKESLNNDLTEAKTKQQELKSHFQGVSIIFLK